MIDQSRFKFLAILAIAGGVLAAAGYGLIRRSPFGIQPPLRNALSASAASTSGHGTISGLVTTVTGAPKAASITLVRTAESLRALIPGRARGAGFGRIVSPISTSAGADGHFTLHNVPAGTFWLFAHAPLIPEAPGLPVDLWASRDVVSDGRAALEAPLTLQEGGTITGVLEFAATLGTPRPDLTGMVLRLSPIDARTQAQLGSGAPQARPDDSGAFAIAAIAPGRYTIDLSEFSGWTLDSAVVDGTDCIDRPFDAPPGWGMRRAKLVFTDRPNVIAGVVRHADGRPAARSLVIAFSDDVSLQGVTRRVQATRADADGRFTITGLPAGGYFVAPAGGLPIDQWYRPESFRALAPSAARVSVARGETKSLTIMFSRD